MNRPLKLAVVSVLSVLVWGCGGSGATNPFAFVNWTGSWTESSIHQTGTWTVLIANDGFMTGTATNATLSLTGGDVAGNVDSSGNVSATCQYGANAPTTITGKFVLTTQTHIHGTLVETGAGNPVNMTMDLDQN